MFTEKGMSHAFNASKYKTFVQLELHKNICHIHSKDSQFLPLLPRF